MERVLQKIISGGQTGADRCALEVAHKLGFETGGTAARNFMTEKGCDFTLRDVYGLQEIDTRPYMSYTSRSRRNVDDADVTVVFRLCRSAGSDKTIGYAQTKRWTTGKLTNINTSTSSYCVDVYRPVFVVQKLDDVNAVQALVDFLQKTRARTVNIAGHRASTAPVTDFNDRVCDFLTRVLRQFTRKTT